MARQFLWFFYIGKRQKNGQKDGKRLKVEDDTKLNLWYCLLAVRRWCNLQSSLWARTVILLIKKYESIYKSKYFAKTQHLVFLQQLSKAENNMVKTTYQVYLEAKILNNKYGMVEGFFYTQLTTYEYIGKIVGFS